MLDKTHHELTNVNNQSNIDKIGPLLTSKTEKLKEFKQRKDLYVYENITHLDLEKYLNLGWEIVRTLKKSVRIKKLKPNDQLLQDQTWCLFYRMGYPEISDKNFSIECIEYGGEKKLKQIDVFAKDEETVVVIECVSRETRGRKSLNKELADTGNSQKSIANTIKKHYGDTFKPKIIWMYVTNNIIWSESDLIRAGELNVRVVTENEMQYFDAYIKHMGPAGRYQFLAEFLANQEIPNLSNLKVPAIRGRLGRKPFYSFVTTPRTLLKIAFVNHQALNNPDGRPAYQRMITPSRIKEIESYIKGGGFFPTNILVNFIDKCRFDLLSNKDLADSSIKFGWLYLPNKYKSAWIIDGQHRLYGYSHLDDDWLDESLAVIAFEEMSTNDEANLFVTINQKQKSVQKSVIVSLQADLKWGSSDPKERISALASALVKTLNSDPTTPFFQRLSVQGVAGNDNQSLTFPEFVNGVTRSGLLGKVVNKTQYIPGPLSAVNDEATLNRSKKIINHYFSLIRESNTNRWDEGRAGYISTNPGIRAHFLLLSEAIRYLEIEDGIDVSSLSDEEAISKIKSLIQPLIQYLENANDTEIFDKFSRKFGEGGVIEYFDNLCTPIYLSNKNFGTSDFKDRIAKRNDDRVGKTHQEVIKICKTIADFVIEKLKSIHGDILDESGEKVWWEQGIESQKAKKNAYDRYLENKDKKLPKESYLDLIEYKEIVKQTNNWDHFESVFSIQLPDERRGKKYYLDWMDNLNKIRRIAAHPSGNRGYEEADYGFMKFITSEFYSRINNTKGSK